MAASSILTPSQSGIIGEGGRKVLKTRVQVLGRYLLEPGIQALSTDAAVRLVERAKAGRARVRTPLTLFSNGVRLGERGLFAPMKCEFIDYFRLSDIVTPPGYSTLLVICVKDYEQRCATVLQFKDDVCLRVVLDVIDRHRRALFNDDVARISDVQSLSSELRLSAAVHDIVDGGGDGGGGVGDGNWRLMKPASVANGSLSGSRTSVPEGDVLESALIDERESAAVIQQSRVLEAANSPSRSRSEISKEAKNNGKISQQPRYQKNHLRHHPESQQQPQQVRYSWSPSLAAVPDASAAASDLDDVETAAIFETPEGPPTLLNELVRRSELGGFVESLDFENDDSGVRQRRMVELPPEFVARVRVGGGTASVLGRRDSEEPESVLIPY